MIKGKYIFQTAYWSDKKRAKHCTRSRKSCSDYLDQVVEGSCCE